MILHIALFMSDLGGGGTQRRFLALSQAFTAAGQRVDLVVASGAGDFRGRIPATARLVALDAAAPPLLHRRRGLRVATSTGRLARYLAAEAPDVLLASSNPANLVALTARARSAGGRARPLPVAISVNVDLEAAFRARRRLHGGLLRLLARRRYSEADAVIAISEGVAASISAVASVPRQRVVTIPNPIDTAAIRLQASQSITHSWLAPGAPPLILAVGKLKPQKDFETLLRAFARLRTARQANLMILGEGEQRRPLTALVGKLGLGACIAMPGFADNPYAWMARARLLVLSSRWEGFSNVLAEALAVGCPVASTDCPSGPAELLENGAFGPLVPVGDAEALAAAMCTCLDHPIGRERLMARAERFSVEQAAARYLAVLESIVAASTSGQAA